MEIERRALYNSLRMNWLRDPALKVENWQVEDLRSLPTDKLLARLQEAPLSLDKDNFARWVEASDSPENLTDELLDEVLADERISQEEADACFLLIFELWRRLFPEKQSLSLFCDELDHQIHRYDTGTVENSDAFHETLARLLHLLHENAESGISPKACMEVVQLQSASDIEPFLYDFLSEELYQGNFSHAREFIEGFKPFIQEKRWFELLTLRLKVAEEEADLEAELLPLMKRASDESLDFFFEILIYLTKSGEPKIFSQAAKKALSLIETEDDFKDFLSLTADFYHFLDDEVRENKLLAILKARKKPEDALFMKNDPSLSDVKKIIFG